MARNASTKAWFCAALLALMGWSTGCTENGAKDEENGPNATHPSDPIVRGRVIASLARASGCEDLLSKIQDDVVAKIELQAEVLKHSDGPTQSPVGGTGGDGSWVGGTAGTFATPPPFEGPSTGAGAIGGTGGASGASAAAGAGGASGFGAGTGAQSPDDGAAGGAGTGEVDNGGGTVNLGPGQYSETNTQIEGVDEADIVKSDGLNMYVIHGNELVVLDTWPAASSEIAGGVNIEGEARELFVHEGMAVVFSSLYDQGDLIAPASDDDASQDGFMADARYGYNYNAPFTKITVVDVTDSMHPVSVRELIIEGTYLSSRRHDKIVRAVIQGGFRTPPLYAANIEYTDPWGRRYEQEEIDRQVDAWRDRMIAGVRSTKIGDWLPAEREVMAPNDDHTGPWLSPPDRRCTDFYAPPAGLSDYGLTNIVAFDMLDPNASLGGALVLGNSEQVYSSADSLVLAHVDYRWDAHLLEHERTVLHQFDLGGDDTLYRASGFVPGHILDQFSMDVHEGVLRVATVTRIFPDFVEDVAQAGEDDWNDVATLRSTDNRVLTLRAEGEKLVRHGITEPLGEDGETIQSTRFLGDRGYVVTFRNTDPLIVVDLSDAKSPEVLGELHIPGFSDYMHPIDEDHLLTIGRNVDQLGTNTGLLLQIFDVSDPTSPRQTHTFPYSQPGWSEANDNHKAFTYFQPDADVPYDGLLAFPFVDYSGAFSSTLEVFQVSLDDGFTRIGSIDHSQLIQDCYTANNTTFNPFFIDPYLCGGSPEVRRGMFVFGIDSEADQFVYSLSFGGVLVHDLADLVTPVATVRFPSPDNDPHRLWYGEEGTIGGTGGIVGGTSGIGGAAGVGIGGFPAGGIGGAAGVAGTGFGGVGGAAGGSAGLGGPFPVDAGIPQPAVDAGMAPDQDAGTDVGGTGGAAGTQ